MSEDLEYFDQINVNVKLRGKLYKIVQSINLQRLKKNLRSSKLENEMEVVIAVVGVSVGSVASNPDIRISNSELFVFSRLLELSAMPFEVDIELDVGLEMKFLHEQIRLLPVKKQDVLPDFATFWF